MLAILATEPDWELLDHASVRAHRPKRRVPTRDSGPSARRLIRGCAYGPSWLRDYAGPAYSQYEVGQQGGSAAPVFRVTAGPFG
jgi:hypothetical protein